MGILLRKVEQFTKSLLVYLSLRLKLYFLEGGNKIFVPSVKLEGNQFLDNEALENGGAIFLNWESLVLDNTEFLRNKAGHGGALFFLNLGK